MTWSCPRCASKRRQNVPCYRRNILTAMNGTANRFHIVSARFPIRSSLSFMYFVRRARGRERKKGERRRSREKGEWRRNLALTGLHSLKIKLVHHTYTHTHAYTHKPSLPFSYSLRPAPPSSSTKTNPSSFCDKVRKLQTFYFVGLSSISSTSVWHSWQPTDFSFSSFSNPNYIRVTF